jgi:uncharacterized membrane protein YqiK
MLLLQLPTDPPDSLRVLQWVIILVLVSALVYIFKAWQSDRRECQDQRAELLEKTLTGLADVREVLSGLTVVIESTKEQYETFQAIQDILRRLDRHEKSD